VRILLDECVDWRLSRDIVGHEVKTARQMGWSAVKNGELLARAIGAGFEAFVTSDRNLSYQQNLTALPIAIFVLKAPSNRLVDLQKLVPALVAAVKRAKPGVAVTLTGD
jgi:hypothetical protein